MLFKITFLTTFIPIIKLYNQILIFWHSWSLAQHIFVVFGVSSYVVATKCQNHLYYRIPQICPQILSGKSCMGSNGSRVGAWRPANFAFSIIFLSIRERLEFTCCYKIGIETIENDEKYYWKYVWHGFLDGGSMCFKTSFFQIYTPLPP